MTHPPKSIEAGPARLGSWSAAAGALRARLAAALRPERASRREASLVAVELISQAEEDARLAEIERLTGEALRRHDP